MKTRAAVIEQLGTPFATETLNVADPIGREVLIRVKASGLCHSDLHAATMDMGFPLPAVFGHELAGVVEDIGPDVVELEVGDHVVASLVMFCGECPPCRQDRTYQCVNPSVTQRAPDQPARFTREDGAIVGGGFGVGGFSEFTLVHENQVVRVPEDLPFPEAAILGCATITGAGAVVNAARVRTGEGVAVIGLGGIGLNVISGARLVGADPIIAIDTQPAKLDVAGRFGATHTILAGDDVDVVGDVRQITGGGVAHSFEAIGLAQTVRDAIQMTRVGGTVNLIGIHRVGSEVSIDPNELLTSQRTIRGVFMGSTNIKRDIPLYARLFQQGRLNLSDLIAREISIDDVNEAYEQMRTGALARSVITRFGRP